MKQYYEAVLYSLNGAKARMEFEADSTDLGNDHAQTLANTGTKGYEWDRKPKYIGRIEYRKKGRTRWNKRFPTRFPLEQ